MRLDYGSRGAFLMWTLVRHAIVWQINSVRDHIRNIQHFFPLVFPLLYFLIRAWNTLNVLEQIWIIVINSIFNSNTILCEVIYIAFNELNTFWLTFAFGNWVFFCSLSKYIFNCLFYLRKLIEDFKISLAKSPLRSPLRNFKKNIITWLK